MSDSTDVSAGGIRFAAMARGIAVLLAFTLLGHAWTRLVIPVVGNSMTAETAALELVRVDAMAADLYSRDGKIADALEYPLYSSKVAGVPVYFPRANGYEISVRPDWDRWPLPVGRPKGLIKSGECLILRRYLLPDGSGLSQPVYLRAEPVDFDKLWKPPMKIREP